MKRAIFILGALTAGLVICFWQATAYTDPPSMNERFVSVDCVAPTPHESFLRPDCAGEYHFFSRKIPFRTNQQGLRDRNYSPYPAKGATRILYLGDSLVWGSGLDESQTIPRRLETELNRRGGRFEVINGASLSALPEEQFRTLPVLLAAYHPQVVILQMNGGQEIRDSVWRAFLFPDGHREIYRTAGWLADRRTLFVNGMRAAWSAFRLRYLAWWKLKREGAPAALAELTTPTLQKFLLAKAFVSSHGAEPIIVTINQAPSTLVFKPLFARILAPFLRASPRTTFPLAEYEQLPAFRTLEPVVFSKNWNQINGSSLVLPDNTHLTAEGTQELAHELADALWARWYPTHR